ncbi:MAG: radical SAM family heme chaperone HemW [Bacteroidaceae bacterium]|nr:radical SAM family heme chaperone HemW [Bacteroidaceae bacterium]
MPTDGLYIHVPFCKSRCIYCDFYSTTCGADKRQAYAEALCHEMRLRRDFLDGGTLGSVYIGGGTPSTLSADELGRIFQTIATTWSISADAEVTLEANPDDITPAYAKALKALGINRVSMGVQTFNDGMLRFLHRRHSAGQVQEAIDHLQGAGIDNLSIDLIYGLPGQTLEQWQQDVGKALALPVSHLSAYALIYEEGTALYRLREQGKAAEASDELSLQMFEALMDMAAKAGFRHYEISNFALPHREARHNSGYWTGMHYLGLGPAAHSYNGTVRQWNTPDLSAYLKAGGDTAAGLITTETLTPKIRQEETLLTRLRTAEGLDLAAYAREFGQQALDALLARAKPYINNGTLVLCDAAPESFINGQWSMVNAEGIASGSTAVSGAGADFKESRERSGNGQWLCLTRQGIFISDGIISSLFED